MSLVFVIEDEPIMAECMALAVEGTAPIDDSEGSSRPRTEIFYDAVSAMNGLREQLPDAILLDVMLVGPDGFAFLNEMVSYTDTARIPVILVTTLDLAGRDLSHYGVISVLDKATMTPDDIQNAVRAALEHNKQDLVQPASPVLPPALSAASSPAPEIAHSSETGLAAFNQQLGSGEK